MFYFFEKHSEGEEKMKKTLMMCTAILSSVMIGETMMTALLSALLVVGTLTELLLSDQDRQAVKDPASLFCAAFRKVRSGSV